MPIKNKCSGTKIVCQTPQKKLKQVNVNFLIVSFKIHQQICESKHKNHLPTESIYDSNRMYEAILNTNNNGNVQSTEISVFQNEYLDDEPQNCKPLN